LALLSGINMLNLKIKNIKLQRRYNQYEKTRVLGKFIEKYISGLYVSKKFSFKLREQKILKRCYYNKVSRIRLNARCIFTNRVAGVSKKYGASRFILRNFTQFGFIPGFKKAIW